MPRPQFTLRALLVAMLVVAAFFGGMQFERERRRRADEVAARAVPYFGFVQSQLQPSADFPARQFRFPEPSETQE